MKITPLPDEHVLTDGEGVELASGEKFLFRCCDCSLVHQVVIVSQDGKPVGLALKREPELTEERRQGPPELDDWQFKVFQHLVDFYRVYTGGGDFHVRWYPALAHLATPKGLQHVPFRKLTYGEFLRRLGQGLISPGGRENHRTDNDGTPGRSGIWREDASGQWVPLT